MERQPAFSIPRILGSMARTETYLFGILILLVTAVSLVSPRFFSAENFFSIALSYSYTGIFAIGFLFVLLSGGFDVSFTAVATVAQYLMAVVLTQFPDVPFYLAVLVPLATGLSLGLVNALLIHCLRAPAIIITIANLNIYYGILQFVSNGVWLYNFPPWFNDFPQWKVLTLHNPDGVEYGLSILTVLWLAVAVIGSFTLNRLKVGRRLYAMGGNLEAAQRGGIHLLRHRLFAYGVCGFTAGLGGLVHTFVTQTVAPNTLVGHEFDVVAAVVLGGASIFGGSGTVGGTLLGVGLIALLGNALTIMMVPTFWHEVFIGAVVLLSITITAWSARLAQRRENKIHG